MDVIVKALKEGGAMVHESTQAGTIMSLLNIHNAEVYLRKYNPRKILRKLVRKIYKGKEFSHQGEQANQLISDLLQLDKPFMISRFGETELNALLTYLNIQESNYLAKLGIFCVGGDFHWNNNIRFSMKNNAGFFPTDNESLSRFAQLYLSEISNIDVLGSWLPGEKYFLNSFDNINVIRLKDIEPYYHKNPWSEFLRGKRVLVVHPFVKSIDKQYKENRQKLFKDKRLLPDFELITLKSIQSIAGSNTRFNTWFDALDWMRDEINKINFDVAIIGAGAYGLPLASYVKRIGKQAVHMGGATQILFGIKGGRWDKMPFFQQMYNDSWVRPLQEEIPVGSGKVESACYW